MIPALHCAITSAGCEMMNSGAPTTGKRSFPRNDFGNDMGSPGFVHG
jgi:hypothetical protein